MTDCNTEHMIAQLEDEAIQELQGGPAPELICTDLKKPLNNDEKAKELSCDDSVSDICQAAKITIKTPTPEYVKSLRFRPISLEELLKMPSKEWLVEHLFGAKDLGMIYGPPGCGKTFVIIDLIYSMCLGEKWANKFDIKRPLTVWYCAGEGISGLQARFAAAADNRGIESLENLSFFDKIPQFFDLTNGDGINEFFLAVHVSKVACA